MELEFDSIRKKEYLEKKEKSETTFFDDCVDKNQEDSDVILDKRNKEAQEREKNKADRIKKLNELAEKGTLYIKGGLK